MKVLLTGKFRFSITCTPDAHCNSNLVLCGLMRASELASVGSPLIITLLFCLVEAATLILVPLERTEKNDGSNGIDPPKAVFE